MPYVSKANLSRFWRNAKKYINNHDIGGYLWKFTEEDTSVSFYPNPGAPLYPIVYFKFTETLPSGTKSSSNPSTITGVSGLTLTLSSDIPSDESTSTIEFPATYYQGYLDYSSEKIYITHLSINPTSTSVDISSNPADPSHFEYTDTYGRIITTVDGNTLTLPSSGGQVIYKLATPIEVLISLDEIESLPQSDRYTPKMNTITSSGYKVSVGYAASLIEHNAFKQASDGDIDNLFVDSYSGDLSLSGFASFEYVQDAIEEAIQDLVSGSPATNTQIDSLFD